jgi:hypothetical protein
MWNPAGARRRSGPLALLGAVLVLSGCGGASSRTAGSRSTSTAAGAPAVGTSTSAVRTGPLARAETICARLNRAIATAVPVKLDPKKIAAAAPAHAALERKAVEELSRLHAPPGLAVDWRKIIVYRRTLARELSTLVHLAETGNVAGIRALAASKRRVHRQLSAIAARDGFKACARVG